MDSPIPIRRAPLIREDYNRLDREHKKNTCEFCGMSCPKCKCVVGFGTTHNKRLRNLRTIALEIEVNSISKHQYSKVSRLREALSQWHVSVVEDGSIGGLPTAFEMNLQPARGDMFIAQLSDVCSGLNEMKIRPNDDCGIHVHVAAHDYNYWDMANLLRLYEKVEQAMFDMCNPFRLNAPYAQVCGPMWSARIAQAGKANPKLTIIKRLYNTDLIRCIGEKNKEQALHYYSSFKSQAEHKSHSTRYNALNVHSWFLRGTFEFRHHHSTVDYDTIYTWARVCQEVVTSALRLGKPGVAQLPENSRAALLSIMPKELHPRIELAWVLHDQKVTAGRQH